VVLDDDVTTDEPRPPAAHRESVVRRLLDRGLSVRTLLILLPDWRGLIERVAVDG
jgi:hypothetical protein